MISSWQRMDVCNMHCRFLYNLACSVNGMPNGTYLLVIRQTIGHHMLEICAYIPRGRTTFKKDFFTPIEWQLTHAFTIRTVMRKSRHLKMSNYAAIAVPNVYGHSFQVLCLRTGITFPLTAVLTTWHAFLDF